MTWKYFLLAWVGIIFYKFYFEWVKIINNPVAEISKLLSLSV